MQDIDFGRFYRQKRRVSLSEMAQEKKRRHSPLSNRNTLLAIAAMGIFLAGLVFGSRWERYSYTRQIENNAVGEEISTANIAPPETKEIHNSIRIEKNSEALAQPANEKKVVAVQEQVEQALKNSKDAYLILAKIYSDEKDAYLHGRELKKQGLPVFLARSGKKVKVYVGPIEGKNAAYQHLSLVKSMPEFRSAIMYKK